MENNNQNLNKKEIYDLRKSEKEGMVRNKEKSKATRRFFLWGAIVLIVVAGAWAMVRFGGSSDQPGALTSNTVSETDWVKGNKDAKAVLIEYGDFQCPACGTYYLYVKKLQEEIGDKMQFVYRHFPLRNIHKNADLAARASEAAGIQGKFWEMYDKIFDNQGNWSGSSDAENIFSGYAQALGLDVNKFKEDIDSDAVKNKVESDYQGGIKSKVNSTPSFFLNGKLIRPLSYDEFKGLINQAASGS